MTDTVWIVATVASLVLVFSVVMYALVFAHAARVVRTIGGTHRPVQFVTHKFGVVQHGLVSLQPQTRVLVPSGPYRGFWTTTDRGPWNADDDRDAVAGDTVTDTVTRQMYVCNADGDWTSAVSLVCPPEQRPLDANDPKSLGGGGTTYCVDGDMRAIRFEERGPELLMRNAPDGPYLVVTADGNVHPAAVVDGQMYSNMPVSKDGTRLQMRHAARVMPAPAFLRGAAA